MGLPDSLLSNWVLRLHHFQSPKWFPVLRFGQFDGASLTGAYAAGLRDPLVGDAVAVLVEPVADLSGRHAAVAHARAVPAREGAGALDLVVERDGEVVLVDVVGVPNAKSSSSNAAAEVEA